MIVFMGINADNHLIGINNYWSHDGILVEEEYCRLKVLVGGQDCDETSTGSYQVTTPKTYKRQMHCS